MPKQLLHYGRVWRFDSKTNTLREYDGAELAENETLRIDPSVNLHWDDADRHPQLSFTIETRQLKAILESVEDGTTQAELGPENFPERVKIYTDVLSRDDLQRTIRSARSARNKVYGSDE